jgi:hypothetical protein
MPEGDLLGKLAADVVGSEGGGAVTAICEGGLQVLGRGVRGELHGSAPGAERVQKGSRGVCARRQGGQLVPTAGGPTNLCKRVLIREG